MCRAPLTLAILIIRGLICLPCVLIAYINGLFLPYLVLVACWMDLLCVNMNLIICMLRLGFKVIGPVCSNCAPVT